MNTENFQEIEIKFYVRDLSKLEKRLQALNAQLHQSRTHELNLRFDTPDMRLTKSFQVLRLRQDQDIHLTYKSSADPTSEVSVRKEVEFKVGDLNAARWFLESLGYQVTITYEKYRTTYRLDTAEIVLDELPYGSFVEIEAASLQEIKILVNKLELNWDARIKLSYLAIFNQIKEKFNLPVSNLLFREFKELSFSMEGILRDGLNA